MENGVVEVKTSNKPLPKVGEVKKAPVKVEQVEVESNEPQIDPNKTYVFELLPEYARSKHFGLANVCEVYDEELGRRRKMRYVPYFDSIWLDEQPSEDVVSLTDHPINFFGGILRVQGTDKNKVLFLMNHDRAEGRPKPISTKGAQFRLQNPDAIAKKGLDISAKQSEALVIALSLREKQDELKMIGFVLFGQYFESEMVLLQKVVDFAKENPQQFLDICDDPRTNRRYIIKQGLEKQIIVEKFSMLKWTQSGTDIVQLPPDRDMLNFITDWSFSDDGKDFVEVLKRQLSK